MQQRATAFLRIPFLVGKKLFCLPVKNLIGVQVFRPLRAFWCAVCMCVQLSRPCVHF